jgi:hypothetical protein
MQITVDLRQNGFLAPAIWGRQRPRSCMNKQKCYVNKLETLIHNTCSSDFKTKRTLWRWLCIGLIDVLLNAPENIFRLIVILDLIDLTRVGEFYLLGRMFAQVNYKLFATLNVCFRLFITHR